MIALSLTEAKFIAASNARKYVLYLHSILDEVYILQDVPSLLCEDSMGVYKMAALGGPTTKTKYINMWVYAIQDWIKHDLLRLEYIPAAHNIAETFTKNLAYKLFHQHNNILMGNLLLEMSTAYMDIQADIILTRLNT